MMDDTVDASLPGEGTGDTNGELTTASLVRMLKLVRADLEAVFQNEEATPEQLLEQIVTVATRLVPGADDATVAVYSDGSCGP